MRDNIKLIKKCQKGSNEALDKLLKLYANLMYGICLRYCKNKFEADDVMQEACINLVEKINDFKFKGSFEGWVRRISINTSINYLKKKSRLALDELNTDQENINNLNEFSKEQDVLSKLSVNEIIELINKLPDGYRTVFNLHVIEGYKHVEIAEMLNITANTSRTQYMKARKMLANMIRNLK